MISIEFKEDGKAGSAADIYQSVMQAVISSAVMLEEYYGKGAKLAFLSSVSEHVDEYLCDLEDNEAYWAYKEIERRSREVKDYDYADEGEDDDD